jgi:DNA adenine methylase
LAREIVDTILSHTNRRHLVIEPFMGGGAVTEKLVDAFDEVYASDAHEDVMLMWQAVQIGWTAPDYVTEENYKRLKTLEPSVLRGFVGMGGSFGGKWFGGYARGGFNADGTPRNHLAESARAVNRIGKKLRSNNVHLNRLNYKDALSNNIEPAVIYHDPPYAATQGYAGTASFDSAEFWETMNKWVDLGHHVFVSEYTAPDDWECVWQKQHRQSLVRGDQNRFETTEKLFTKRVK